MPPDPAAFHDCLVLTGPTGSGKSALAMELAERLDGEIIALDSMTLYRGMDIGTAKPSPDDRRRVPHHLIDVLDPWESASVAWYLERAAAAVVAIRGRGRRPIFVGGTPFYLKAMLAGLFESPPADCELRAKLEAEPAEELHRRLVEVDPAAAARLHPNDVRRVVRALEVRALTGRPLSEWQTQWAGESRSGPTCLCLDWPRDELYHRIDARVEAMIAAGWLDEVRRLRGLSRPLSREASKALGYADLGDVLDGKVGLAEALGRIRQKSRNYAKRQLTWFRHLPGVKIVAPELTIEAAFSTIQPPDG